MTEQLEPCPFCGEKLSLIPGTVVTCDSCGAEGPMVKRFDWNTRADTPISHHPDVKALVSVLVGPALTANREVSNAIKKVQPDFFTDLNAALKQLEGGNG